MRTLLITLAGVLALGLGAANAQTIDDTATTRYYGGASLGFATASGFTTGSFTGHFGYEDFLTDNLDGRVDLGIFFTGGITLGFNGLYNFDLEGDVPISIYAGGGPRLYIEDDLFFGLGARVGGDYGFSDVLSAFAELRLDPVFGPSTITVFGLGAGVNYKF